MIVLILLFYITSIISQMLGPADITIHRIEKCGEDQSGLTIKWIMKKINRTHLAINVYIDSPFDFDENVSFNLSVSKWGDGGWKPNILNRTEPDICIMFQKYLPKVLNETLEILQQPQECPVRKGIYNLTNYIINTDLDFPIMFGEFKIDALIIRDGIGVSCFKGFIKSVPKSFKKG